MRKLIISALSFCFASACSFLDTRPVDFVDPGDYYKNSEQLETALLGVYSELAVNYLYGNDMLGRMGLDADLGYEHHSGDKTAVGYYDVSSSDAMVSNYWKAAYVGINRANMLLENIDGADAPAEVKSRIRGEALFLRGLYYFLLVPRFGDVPLVLSATHTAKPGEVQVARTPKKDVYLQIINDLEEAADLLPEAGQVSCGSRASKSAAWGLMARVCLNMAGYPVYEKGMYAKAREAAANVINSGHHSLNPSYSQVFINLIQDIYDIKECIFEVDFWGNDTGTYTDVAGMVGRNNGVFFNNSTYSEEVGISIGCLRSTRYFYELFEEGDTRRDWTIADFQYDDNGNVIEPSSVIWERCCGKFRRSYEIIKPRAKDKTPTNFPVLRYSDVLLMYAEAVACDPEDNDAGDIARAYEYMNQVRRRAFGFDILSESPVDVPDEGKYLIMDTLEDERARELGFELTRKDDLIRWGVFYPRMKEVQSMLPSSTATCILSAALYFGNVEAKDELWPVPSREIGTNASLEQNPGW
ncbi:MAG: RagB/SusD family nutrient uptake outer membrane protein [Bacteroidales bacterium]|nr:RagB/SusD family nutrient uptake outer membrane protein [Bacteroidales bacterium]